MPADRLAIRCLLAALLASTVRSPVAGMDGPSVAPEATARDRAVDWVESRGWKEGLNLDGAIVSVGAAPIPRDRGRPEAARALGFELACLDARNALAGYLAARVATGVGKTTAISGPAADAVRRLAPGGEPGGAPALRSTFDDAVWVLARCELGALVPVASFCTGTSSAPGMMSVVLRHDAASAAVARAFLDGKPVPAEDGLRGIDDWISERGPEAPGGIHGVRVVRGPDGKACIVAFAESDVVDEPRSEFRAEERARLAADGMLRSFLGQFHDGQSVLSRSSELTDVAGMRPSFQSVERYHERVRSSSARIELPRGALQRRWQSPASGPARSIGVAVLVEPKIRLAPVPADGQSMRAASVEVANRILRGSASGVGLFVPSDPSDRGMHPALRRARALRAAVVSAKAELARSVSQSVATAIETQSSDHRESSRMSIDVTIQRALLCGMALVRCEFSGTDEQPECTAWIEGSVALDPSQPATGVRGVPAFPTEGDAARSVAQWASSGLCDQSMVRVFVGPEGSRRLVEFGVGLGVGSAGQTVALTKAQAALVAAAGELIEGTDRMSQQVVFADPLSPEGSRSLVVEELKTGRRRTASGAVRLGGSSTFNSGDGLVAVACWRAE